MGSKGKPKLKEEIDKKKKDKADKGKKKEFKAPSKKMMEGVRGIVRIMGTDVDGTRKLNVSLLKIKGIGQMLSNAVILTAGFNPNTITGTLEDKQIKKLETIIKNPSDYGIPLFSLNRRKDRDTGEDKHIVSADLTFIRKSDVDRLKKLHAYRGIRHEMGLPSRGQRTRSSFRKGARVGVSKKAAKKEKAPAATPERKIPKFWTPKVLPKAGEKKKE